MANGNGGNSAGWPSTTGNPSGGGRDNVATHIFATAPTAVAADRIPVSVTLPKNRDLRIFTLATG